MKMLRTFKYRNKHLLVHVLKQFFRGAREGEVHVGHVTKPETSKLLYLFSKLEGLFSEHDIDGYFIEQSLLISKI